MQKRFYLGIVVILAIYVISAWLVGEWRNLDSGQWRGILFAGILATLNVVVAFLIIRLIMHKPAKSFNKSFLISLGVRFLLLLILILTIIQAGQVDLFVFLASLFILYFVYQYWEILILNKHLK